MKFLLGSSSPRRAELLKMIGLSFSIEKSLYNEREIRVEEDIWSYSKELSVKKGEEILTRVKSDLLLTSDTIVELSGKVLGKPKDKSEAREMLRNLSGAQHQVITSFAFFKGQNLDLVDVELSKVMFKKLSSQDIDHYIDSANYLDKAGAYGIQDHGQAFAQNLEGNFSNVVGLPLNRVLDYLESRFGSNWRNNFE